MAKAPKVPAAQAAPKPAKKTVTVIYRPIDIMDPNVTKWNGITFHANVPVELDPANKAHYIVQLLPKEFAGPDGEVRTKHKEEPVFMGDMARENPSFEVDGKKARRKISSRKVPPPGAEWSEAHEGEISYSDEIDTSVAA
jgi:hypothetical protein